MQGPVLSDFPSDSPPNPFGSGSEEEALSLDGPTDEGEISSRALCMILKWIK